MRFSKALLSAYDQDSMKLIYCLPLFLIWTRALATPLYPLTGMEACDEASTFAHIPTKDFSDHESMIQWSDRAALPCPGAGFPRVVAKHVKAEVYVHLVTASIAVPTELSKDPSWNPLELKSPWKFLDISDDARKQEQIFYTIGSTFHDNPKWDAKELTWIGHAYGLQQKSENHYEPVVGFAWGFALNNGKLAPRPPRTLGKSEWTQDALVLRKVLTSWKNPKIKL